MTPFKSISGSVGFFAALLAIPGVTHAQGMKIQVNSTAAVIEAKGRLCGVNGANSDKMATGLIMQISKANRAALGTPMSFAFRFRSPKSAADLVRLRMQNVKLLTPEIATAQSSLCAALYFSTLDEVAVIEAARPLRPQNNR